MPSPFRAPEPPTDDLGALLREHRDFGDRSLLVVGTVGAVALPPVASMVVGLPVWMTALLAVAGMLGAARGRAWLRARSASGIELHEHGLVQRVQGTRGAAVRIHFDEVSSVRSDRQRHARSGVETERHVVEAADGRKVVWTLLHDGARDLLAAVEARVFPRVRAASLRAFDEGETVAFGPFALDGQGLRAGTEQVIAWPDVGSVSVEGGFVHVWKAGADGVLLCRRGVSLVPNAPVAVEMIELAASVARDGEEEEEPRV